jgi:hypothetical protein
MPVGIKVVFERLACRVQRSNLAHLSQALFGHDLLIHL